jgi:predicted O-methyltransferase YrrM
MNLKSLRAIARGAAVALRDPRLFARIPPLVARETEQRRVEALAREAFGGAPRTVPIESVVAPEGGEIGCLSFLDDATPVTDLLLLRALMARGGGRYLEVGTLRGESALAVAGLASEVVTISLPDEELLEMGADRSFVQTHRVFSSGHPNVRHVLGNSRSMDLSEFQGWADLVFIDGDHTFAGVASDTRRFWATRRDESTPVVWHDAFLSPLKPRWEVLAGIAEGLPPNRRSEIVHVSNTLCAAWLPDAAALPTVGATYFPRVAFSVTVAIRDDWTPPKPAELKAT